MDLKEVCRAVGFTKTSIYKWMDTGEFPKSIKIGRCVRWASNEIDDWIAKKINEPRA
ncbi:helix-turn-helix transcriptional regulator [Yokenella regensburgei]|uniref:helix-turn-helix transcriptional regulator n=1 Tax=Yokenella regensburgei TaxID=158877 RepID=UPI003ED9AF56